MSYEQFVEYNFDPGFYEMCADILHYTPEEIRYQEAEWERAAAVTIPAVYEGLPEILHTYMENGGQNLCVFPFHAKDDFERLRGGRLPTPELIFDWACPEGKRKPHPYALQETMRILNLKPEELLMVDDLKPGYEHGKSVWRSVCLCWLVG